MSSSNRSIARPELDLFQTPARSPAYVPAAADHAGVASTVRLAIDYLGISLLVMLPLWRPGFVLTMDAVFVPHYRFVTALAAHDQAMSTMLALLNLVLPGDIIEKLLFTMILLLAGLGIHRVVEVESSVVRYVAGLAAIFNPFVYDRFMYGQWSVVLSYALLPWLLTSLRVALGERTQWPVWPALRVAGWWTIITLVSLPMGLIAAAAVGIVLLCHVVIGHRSSWRRELGLAALLVGWCAFLNAYWMIAEIVSPGAGATRAAGFSPAELSAFATQIDSTWGSVVTVLGGYGFWAEGSTRFIDMRSVLPYWPAEVLALIMLGSLAVWTAVRHRQRDITIALVVSLLVAAFLGIGIASPITAAPSRFLFDHLALYRGMRDIQKWVALALVAEIALAAQGLDVALVRIAAARRRTATVLAGACFVLPILFAPALFWGFAGQLHPVEYPSSWFAANNRLRADPHPGVTLFLPWHEYLRFPFTGRVVANPAQAFFDIRVMQGDNLEMRSIASDSVNPVSATVRRLLAGGKHNAPHIARALARLNVKYILLARTADWRHYLFLRSAPQVRLLAQWHDLLLYRNAAWHG